MKNQDPNTSISYSKALKYSIFLGWIGADRFYIGDTVFGILKAISLSFYGVFWIVDILIIKSHKNDWDDWIGAKQAKRANKKAAAQAIKEKRLETQRLYKERTSNGQCPECTSTNLTAVSQTTNKLSAAGTLIQLSNPSKFIPNDKIVSKIKRVCLNCGHQF